MAGEPRVCMPPHHTAPTHTSAALVARRAARVSPPAQPPRGRTLPPVHHPPARPPRLLTRPLPPPRGGSSTRSFGAPSTAVGGEGGIRTRGTVTRTHAFQACSFGHSDTSPRGLPQFTVRSSPATSGGEGGIAGAPPIGSHPYRTAPTHASASLVARRAARISPPAQPPRGQTHPAPPNHTPVAGSHPPSPPTSAVTLASVHRIPAGGRWRRGWDSNPRTSVRGSTVFETVPFDHSGTSPRRG